MRQLLPQDLKIEITALDRKEATRVAGYLAAIVGEAHGRVYAPRRAKGLWRKELRRNRAKALNAPSWLLRSVVDLLLEHQRGYLEHFRAAVCRRLTSDGEPVPPFNLPGARHKTVLPQQVIAKGSQSIWDRSKGQDKRPS